MLLEHNTSRQTKLKDWLKAHFLSPELQLYPMQNDASFRRYYRCTIKGSSYVVMDAPPDKENITPFIKITQMLSQFNILVPKMEALDLENGFILLSDLGDCWLLNVLKQCPSTQVFAYYRNAIDSLIQIQQIPLEVSTTLDYKIPLFDAAHIALELSYFSDWFITQLLKLSLGQSESDTLSRLQAILIQSAILEPQCLIHRDYHSRNIMVLPDNQLGIIDYQDAMIGPMSYDLASLLKDCYVIWPNSQIESCLTYFYQTQHARGLLKRISLFDFKKSFDFMALQRHLKVLGVFARLKIRDNKPHYINDMPKIVQYVSMVVNNYSELSEFQKLWQQVILPSFSSFYTAQEVPSCVP